MRIPTGIAALLLASCVAIERDTERPSNASIQIIDLPARPKATSIVFLPVTYRAGGPSPSRSERAGSTFSDADRDILFNSIVGTFRESGLQIVQPGDPAARDIPTVAIQLSRYDVTGNGCVLEGVIITTNGRGALTITPISAREGSAGAVEDSKNAAIRSFIMQLAAAVVKLVPDSGGGRP